LPKNREIAIPVMGVYTRFEQNWLSLSMFKERKAADNLDFELAIELRNQLTNLQKDSRIKKGLKKLKESDS
jgi:hypothetical protein